MNNIILEYRGKLVAGYSKKTGRVYFSCLLADAKKFNEETYHIFVSNHIGEKKNLTWKGLTIHVIKRGKQFDPLKRGDYFGRKK